MVVDTSAIIAMLHNEPEADAFITQLEQATIRLISSVSILEAGILVQSRKGDDGAAALDAFINEAEFEIRPFDAEQAVLARRAFRTFGKGRHAARLNFGDCAVYALAMASGEPLLFKGSDFSKTDVEAA